MTKPLGLYVHWPFCARICPYCDFNVYLDRGEKTDWAAALTTDLAYWAERIARRPLASIYLGGGTPSLAPVSVIADIVERAQNLFGFEDDIEITLEANPNDADEIRLREFASAGVNRLSLGVQSLRDDALKFLGRDHDARSARNAIKVAQSIFPASTFDLIYARPQQSSDDWRRELTEALTYAPDHLSLYQLTIEPGTAFAKAVEGKRWAPPEDDIQALHFDIAQELTAAAGLEAYEISNHARPGRESKHNLIYWRYQDYIGIGPGAHGRVTINNKRVATKAHDRPQDYLKALSGTGRGGETYEILDENAQLIERISMGLRVREGLPLYADDYFYTDENRAERLNRLINDGYLTLNCGTLRATGKGRPLLNRLIYELLG